jgi:hypothetical protein
MTRALASEMVSLNLGKGRLSSAQMDHVEVCETQMQ